MEDYFVEHATAWLADAKSKMMNISNLHEYTLVTGCDLSGDWATVIVDKETQNDTVSFKADTSDLNGPRANLSVWGSWSDMSTVPKRQGPSRSCTHYDEPTLDQCIFIRGVRIYERSWFVKLTNVIKVRARESSADCNPCDPNHFKFLLDTEDITSSGWHFTSVSIHTAHDTLAIFMFHVRNCFFHSSLPFDVLYMINLALKYGIRPRL